MARVTPPIVKLDLDEVARFRALRLRSLDDSPGSFGTRLQEAAAWPPDVWLKLFSGLIAFVAVSPLGDVGLVRCAPDALDPQAARLGSLWVAPEVRGSGVGSALIDAVIEWARTEGFTEIRLDVSDDNAPAVALYELRGFERTGRATTLPPPREHLLKHERRLRLGPRHFD